jgi:carbamoyl-phosphate synthase large subunit
MDRYAFGRDGVPTFVQCPSAGDAEAYERFIDGAVRTHGVKYILPSSEREIGYFHRHRSTYADRGVEVLINNGVILDHFLDKFLTVDFLRRHALPHPRTFLLEAYRGELGYPVVLKKRWGSGSKLVLVARDDEELAFYHGRHGGETLVVQEYLGTPDDEYTAGVFADGTRVYSILFRRYLASDAGITRYAELVAEPDIQGLAENLARVTGLRGSINIQARKVGAVLVPFEINPRISGTAFVRHYFGFRDVEWWLDMKEGMPIRYSPKYAHGVAVRAVSETFFDLW